MVPNEETHISCLPVRANSLVKQFVIASNVQSHNGFAARWCSQCQYEEVAISFKADLQKC